MEVDIDNKVSPGESYADVARLSSNTTVLPDHSTVIDSYPELPDSSTETSMDVATTAPVTQQLTDLSDSIITSLSNSTLNVSESQNVSDSIKCHTTTKDAVVVSLQDEMNVSSSSDNYLQELRNEKELLHPVKCKHTIKLLKDEINRISPKFGNPISMLNQRRPFDNEDEHEHINISEKVFFPVDEYPSYNFVVKLLGPKGSNLKSIATHTRTKISILGKDSTRDRAREEELSKSNDPQHEHFKEPLHVLIQAAGPRYATQLRLNSAVDEIKMYMEDEINYMKSKSENSTNSMEMRRPFDNDPHEYINLSEKVLIPVKGIRTYQFISRLLGPKGSNLKSIATATKTKISILGQGSTRDKSKEEELSKSNDPKHQHFKEPLHVLIQVAGPRHASQVRLNAALEEIKMYIDDEINRVEPKSENSYLQGRRPFDDEEYANLSEKIFFPVDKYPSHNFVGKLLGPKGSNLRSIAAATKTRISILGKGSTRDKSKEEELSNSNDPKHEHFKEPLHVLIQVAGPKYTSHGRLNAAVIEIKKYMEDVINRIDPANSGNSAVSSQERRPFDNEEYVNLSDKIFFPVDKYPSYNFIGKLLGPKGSNLKSIAASTKSSITKTRISILGRGSTRDRAKEEELSKSNDSQHAHFKEPLHVAVHVAGPKYAAQVRLNAALNEIKKYMDPENDEIRMKQMNEYAIRNNPAAHSISSTHEDSFSSPPAKSSVDRQSPSNQGVMLNNTVGWSGDKSHDTATNCDDYACGEKRPMTSDDYLSLHEKKFRDSYDDESYYYVKNDDTYGCSYQS